MATESEDNRCFCFVSSHADMTSVNSIIEGMDLIVEAHHAPQEWRKLQHMDRIARLKLMRVIATALVRVAVAVDGLSGAGRGEKHG